MKKIIFVSLILLLLCSCQPKKSEAEAIAESYKEALSDIKESINEQLDLLDSSIGDCYQPLDEIYLEEALSDPEHFESNLNDYEKHLDYVKEKVSEIRSDIDDYKEDVKDIISEYTSELDTIQEEYSEREE